LEASFVYGDGDWIKAAHAWPATPVGNEPAGPFQPWGIRAAYGVDPSTQLTITWSTRLPVAASVVRISGVGDVTGASAVFFPSGAARAQTVHRVRLTGLAQGAPFSYRVGDGAGNWSDAWTVSPARGVAWNPTIAVYGDMGMSQNALNTMGLLMKDTAESKLDVVVHIGDIAYDLDGSAGAMGDAFGAMMQPLAARKPYMTCPGNHESADDLLYYRTLWGGGMPPAASTSAGGNGTFTSFSVGLIHFALVSSEVYMDGGNQPHGTGLVAEQWEWLDRDLRAVDRAVTPWVALGIHQPLYCSPNEDHDDCHSDVSTVRDGGSGRMRAFGLEPLLEKYGVDIVFGAHEHAYERNYPVTTRFQWNSSRTGPGAYVDPIGTVHVVVGAAGCPENRDGWKQHGNAFSAVRLNDYGYGRLSAPNATHLHWEYVDNISGEVVDELDLVQSAHGSFLGRG
jgi:hypothetical protein